MRSLLELRRRCLVTLLMVSLALPARADDVPAWVKPPVHVDEGGGDFFDGLEHTANDLAPIVLLVGILTVIGGAATWQADHPTAGKALVIGGSLATVGGIVLGSELGGTALLGCAACGMCLGL